MDLPNLLNKITNNQQEPKKFIAIEIGLDTVKAALWQSDGHHTEVISTGSIQSWTSTDQEELFTAIDTSLADALGSLPDEPDQVIFGLPDSWVKDDSTLVEEKKTLLRSVCKKFDFRPIGFVLTTVAITHYLRDVEGGASSYILAQLASNQLAVSLVQNGHLKTTQTVDRSTNLAIDIEEALATIPSKESLPPRILYIANQEDPEPVKQELLAYEWQKKLDFLHVPKVEVLPKDWSIKAVSISGGSEVIQSIGIKSVDTTPPPPPPEPQPKTVEDLGFKSVDLHPANLPLQAPQLPEPVQDEELDNIEPAVLHPPVIRAAEVPSKKFFKLPLDKIRLPKLKLPAISRGLLVPGLIVLAIILLGVGGILAYRYFPSANINVSIAMNPYQQQINFLIDPSVAATDFESNVLAGATSTETVEGTKTITTTGSKMVGERAKGKVIIYNRTTAQKNFKAGTVIKANSLQFTLDTNVTVASASSKENADFSLTIEPSKTEVMVTAADIGNQYNSAKGTQFTLENFATDTFFAVAETAFSGGSSQSVAAVSTADLTTIKTELIKELQTQLGSGSASDSAETKSQVSIGDPTVNEEEYSAVKNEEAPELTLDLSLSQVVYKYDPAELIVIAQTAAAKSLPENTQIRPDSTKVNILSSTVNDNDQAEVTAQVILYHIPRIETGDIVNGLVNVSFDDLGPKLSTLQGYQDYQLTQSKYLFFKRLPPTANQIDLRIIPVTKTEPAP